MIPPEELPLLGGTTVTTAKAKDANKQTKASAPSSVVGAGTTSREQEQQQGGGGISNALRSANKELITKIKSRLGSDEEGKNAFGRFREQSAAWLKGDLEGEAYHSAVTAMGLASLIPALAATCPDVVKREELLHIHANAFSDGAGGERGRSGSWVPPEAAAAAAAAAAAKSSWECERCTLVNAPSDVTCEACGMPKPALLHRHGQFSATTAASKKRHEGQPGALPASPSSSSWSAKTTAAAVVAPTPTLAPSPTPTPMTRPGTRQDDFPALPSTSSGDQQQQQSQKAQSNANGQKKKKQSIQEFYSVTNVHPQNVWKNPALKGQWAGKGTGRLAEEQRALNEAWAKPTGSD